MKSVVSVHALGRGVGKLCYLIFGFAIMASSELAQCSL